MRGPAATAPKGSHGRARSPCLVAQLQRGQQEGGELCGHEPAAGDSSACPFCFAPHGARTWFMSCKRSTPHLGAFRAKRPVQLSIHYPFASFLPRWGCISSPGGKRSPEQPSREDPAPLRPAGREHLPAALRRAAAGGTTTGPRFPAALPPPDEAVQGADRPPFEKDVERNDLFKCNGRYLSLIYPWLFALVQVGAVWDGWQI